MFSTARGENNFNIVWPYHLVSALNNIPTRQRLALARQHKSVLSKSEDLTRILLLLDSGDQLVFAEEMNSLITWAVHLFEVIKSFKEVETKCKFAETHQAIIKNGSDLKIVLPAIPAHARYDYAASICQQLQELDWVKEILDYLSDHERYDFYSEIMRKMKLLIRSIDVGGIIKLFNDEQALEVARELASNLDRCRDYNYFLEAMSKCGILPEDILGLAIARNDLVKWNDVNILSLDDDKEIDDAILARAHQNNTPVLIRKQGKFSVYGDPKGDNTWQFTEVRHQAFIDNPGNIQLTNGVTHTLSHFPAWLLISIGECHKRNTYMSENDLRDLLLLIHKLLPLNLKIKYFDSIKSHLLTASDSLEKILALVAAFISQQYAIQLLLEYKNLINQGTQLGSISQKINVSFDIKFLQDNFSLNDLIKTADDIAAINNILLATEQYKFAKMYLEKITSTTDLCIVLKSLALQERLQFLQMKKNLINDYDDLCTANQLLDPVSAQTNALQFNHLIPIVKEHQAQSIEQICLIIKNKTDDEKVEFVHNNIKFISELLILEYKDLAKNVIMILFLVPRNQRLHITLELDKHIITSAQNDILRMLPADHKDQLLEFMQTPANNFASEVSSSTPRMR
jgi:hypothetical protein